ncbi:MAG: homocysteine biosynthesis protein [Eubacteriales bacterium]|nr:homocysteine biosynthesis protein [Eubacteriales bacterium]
MAHKSLEEINEKIKKGIAVVVTAEEVIGIVDEMGPKKAAEEVDVVTTGTFGAMCSTGMFINFGHSTPPIRMTRVWLNDVPAFAGLAAVDSYIGATELSKTRGMEYGGAHVIEDLIAGKDINLYAESYGTDCYPRKEISTTINKSNINQAYMFNPRNAYQNYPAACNMSDRIIYTYMGTLLPNGGNVTYCTAGCLSPLINDPEYRTIGIGTRVFLGGAQGYVAWEGTQHNPDQERGENGVPISLAGTLALIGDIKQMSTRFIKAAVYQNYGISMFMGVGIPIPILDEDMIRKTAVKDSEIFTDIVDKSGHEGVIRRVSYAELRSGSVELKGRRVQTSPLSSLKVAREIAALLKEEVKKGEFTLTQPVAGLPRHNTVNKLEIRGNSNE